MATLCSTDTLEDARCLASCLTDNQLLAIIACQLATLNGMSCDYQTLTTQAQCLMCLTPNQLLAIIACNGTGGGTGTGWSTAHGNGEPPTDGSITAPAYYDDLTGRKWINFGTVSVPVWEPF